MSEKPVEVALKRRVSGVLVALATMLGAINHSRASDGTDSAALDRSAGAVRSCSFDEMLAMTKGIPTVSGEDAAAICATVTRSLGQRPRINVLRALFKAVTLMSLGGLKDSDSEIAYQVMNIVEARGITDPRRMMSTFDTVCKIVEGTGGHVTPKDLNIALRSSGPAAHTLSDDGVISVATLIWEQKKANGD